jgi:hypothetical protein
VSTRGRLATHVGRFAQGENGDIGFLSPRHGFGKVIVAAVKDARTLETRNVTFAKALGQRCGQRNARTRSRRRSPGIR